MISMQTSHDPRWEKHGQLLLLPQSVHRQVEELLQRKSGRPQVLQSRLEAAKLLLLLADLQFLFPNLFLQAAALRG